MKRLWSLLLVLLLIPCLVMAASAEETSGKCGEDLTWVFEDTTGTLTISGTGEMYGYYREASDPDEDWYYSSAPWPIESVKKVIVEDGVTTIGDGAFLEADSLSEVTLPATLTTIEEYAFYNCSSLTGVVFPDSLTTIEKLAFAFCYQLDRVVLPGNDLLQIDDRAFFYSNLSAVEIPADLTVLPMSALYGVNVGTFDVAEENPSYCAQDGILFNKDQTMLIYCPKSVGFTDGEYTVPNTVTAIGEQAFYGRSTLKAVSIPASVSEMGKDAFSGCYSLGKVYISDMEQWLRITFATAKSNPLQAGAYLYLDGVKITDLVIPEGITAIGNYAFSGMKCSGSLTIPASVTSVGTSAFDFHYDDAPSTINISDLSAWAAIRFASNTANPVVDGGDLYLNGEPVTEVEFPEGITAIGDYVFADCDSLTTVSISDTVTSIGKNSFWDCDSLTSVSIPDSVTTIGESAFERCGALTTVRVSKNLTEVKDSVFAECSTLSSVSLPDTVTRIGDSAFDQCSALASVNIPEGVTAIGANAFSRCRKLTSMTIPDSVTTIGSGAFSYCSGLTELKLGTGVKELGAGAFRECKRIKELSIPGSVGEVPSGLAEMCVSLESLTLGEGITYIDRDAFLDCTKLKSVSFPTTLKQMRREAFENCTALTNFYLQDINTWMHLEMQFVNLAEEGPDVPETYYKFDYLLGWNDEPKNLYVKGKKVTDVVIPADAYLYEYMFSTLSIESVLIPGETEIIPENAFANCASLERVVITEEMADIEYNAFKNCKKLKTVTLPSSLYYVEEYAFAGCENLSKVYYCGSKTQRGKIRIEDGNGRLGNAKWTYNYKIGPMAPVISVTGNTTTGKSKLTWSAVEGADRYRVYRATSKSGSYDYLGYTTGLSYTDKTAKAGTNYYYKVKAVEDGVASVYSNIVNRCCDLRRPVVTLKVDTASGKPKVTWEKISGAEKYYIVRATSKNGTYTKVATVTGTSYIDKNTKAGKTYYYKVKALHEKDAADSVYSAVTSRVCDLKKPVVTIFLKDGDPRIKWEPITGAVKYEVYRATSKDGTYKHVKTTKTSTSYTDTNAAAGKTYYYKVKAIHENTAANSAFSAVKYIKAK